MEGHLTVMKALVSHCADDPISRRHLCVDIDASDHLFTTSLMWAARRGSLAMVKFLVSEGADISLTDAKHKTAIDIARMHHYDRITAYLSRALKREKALKRMKRKMEMMMCALPFSAG